MSRTTKLITYNIKERGRKYTGTDRSNVNVQSMVDAINSPATQELVKTGDLYGYYGHEIRQLYGMNPPDTFITDDGREIRISPAVRTIELRADQEGNVSHRQEFFTNEAGEYAYHQYKAKIGGFSTAVSFIPATHGGQRLVSGFYGFDFVRSPNYATNTSYGVFDGLVMGECGFDGLQGELNPNLLMIKQALQKVIVAEYDNMQQAIQSKNLIDFYQQEAIHAQHRMIEQIERQKQKEARRRDREQAILDSLVCPSRPFADYLAEIACFDHLPMDIKVLQTADQQAVKQDLQDQRLQKHQKAQSFFQALYGVM